MKLTEDEKELLRESPDTVKVAIRMLEQLVDKQKEALISSDFKQASDVYEKRVKLEGALQLLSDFRASVRSRKD
jgi:hypothetical protein